MLLLVPALALTACATPLPPAVRITDIQAVAGTYSGSQKEYGYTPRPSRLVISPDNSYELTTGGPEGARTTGVMAVAPDGTLGYQSGAMPPTARTRGRGTVYQDTGRRVIVFASEDGSITTQVERSLPCKEADRWLLVA